MPCHGTFDVPSRKVNCPAKKVNCTAKGSKEEACRERRLTRTKQRETVMGRIIRLKSQLERGLAVAVLSSTRYWYRLQISLEAVDNPGPVLLVKIPHPLTHTHPLQQKPWLGSNMACLMSAAPEWFRVQKGKKASLAMAFSSPREAELERRSKV